MAFDNSITLNDSDADVVFVAQSRANGAVEYIDQASTSDVQQYLSIRHANAGQSTVKGQLPIKRHLVQLTKSIWNADLGKTQKCVMNLTFTVDPGGSTSLDGAPIALASMLKDFLDDANVNKLVRSEA